MIKLRNVSKQFGNKQIISNLDLDINQGKIAWDGKWARMENGL